MHKQFALFRQLDAILPLRQAEAPEHCSYTRKAPRELLLDSGLPHFQLRSKDVTVRELQRTAEVFLKQLAAF